MTPEETRKFALQYYECDDDYYHVVEFGRPNSKKGPFYDEVKELPF